MLREMEEQVGAFWPHETENWSESFQLGLDKMWSVSTTSGDGLVDKLDDSKLAHDVDDLSLIFEGLADGVDMEIPFEQLEEDNEAAEDDWIEGLEGDAANIDEIALVFESLVSEDEEKATAPEEIDDEEMEFLSEDEDDEEDDEPAAAVPIQFIHAAPKWATMVPLDPRSCIRTPVFKNLDPRIPRIEIPRIDLRLAPVTSSGAVCGVDVVKASRPQSVEAAQDKKHRHDPSTCWICKSSTSPHRKRALHRYTEKRTRRNWKKGPRYSGRSNVATARVRNGGRFICSTQWV